MLVAIFALIVSTHALPLERESDNKDAVLQIMTQSSQHDSDEATKADEANDLDGRANLALQPEETADELLRTQERIIDSTNAEDIEEEMAEQTDTEATMQKRRRRKGLKTKTKKSNKAIKKGGKKAVNTVKKTGDKAVKEVKQGVNNAAKEVEDAFKKFGSKFKDLYNSFKDGLGKKFKLSKVKFDSKMIKGFVKAVDSIKDPIQNLRGEELEEVQLAKRSVSQTVGSHTMCLGGKVAKGIGPVVDSFCKVVKVYTNPIKKAINAIVDLVTGIFPKWLIKIAAAGGSGAGILAQMVFSAFSLGMTFSLGTLGGHVMPAEFEAGFALELKSNLQIGKTGCYLAAETGISFPFEVKTPETGVALSIFKKWENQNDDVMTIGVDGDVCELFGLSWLCSFEVGPSMIFHNHDMKNHDSLAMRVAKTCFGVKGAYEQEQELLQKSGVTMIQLKQDSSDFLKKVINFFEKGFGAVKNCVKDIFRLWTGIVVDLSGGTPDAGTIASGSITFSYCHVTKTY